MANPTVSQNLVPANPTLQDLLDLVKKDIMISLNCHHIGTVQSFDAVKQTAEVTINYKKTYFERETNGLYRPVLVDYPILIDCPVVVLGGGPVALTFPIAKGDECLVLFNDRDIDSWFQSGQVGPVASSRLHSFSDAIILVGIRSTGKAIADYDTTRGALRNGETVVAVGESLVKIANATTTLNTLLQDLLTEIQAITVTCAAPASPSGPPLNAAAIALIATQIGDLLE